MSLGKRIQNARKSKGFTQEYIAELLGVSRQAVSKWEKDLSSPDTGNLIALAEVLDVSVEYLAVGKQPEPPAENQSAAIARSLYRLSLHLLLVYIILTSIGLGGGYYTRMVSICGWGVWFLMYGTSPAAIVLEVSAAICLLLSATFWITGYRTKRKAK